MTAPNEELVGEAWDLDGNRVVIPTEIWRGKVLKDHPELSRHLNDALRAIYSPDHVDPDPSYRDRRRHYLRGAGPSRWFLVVLSYEQQPVRLISAFNSRCG